jgi:hypothetical protein
LESSWELLRFGLFKGLTQEEATAKLGEWCRRQRVAAEFEIRKVREMEVVFVILRPRLHSTRAAGSQWLKSTNARSSFVLNSGDGVGPPFDHKVCWQHKPAIMERS